MSNSLATNATPEIKDISWSYCRGLVSIYGWEGASRWEKHSKLIDCVRDTEIKGPIYSAWKHNPACLLGKILVDEAASGVC